MKQKYILEKLSTFLFYLSILIFLIAFNFQDSKTGGWYQQNMPNLGGKEITDITFLDTLTGYAVANQPSDSTYILKTTNGGDNWSIIHRQYYAMTRIQFLNLNTGFACGGYLYKTTNGGFNWNFVNTPLISAENMLVFSQDSIWILDTDPLVGGIFRTTNGGQNWQKLDNGIFGSTWPDKIYFINSRIGFASNSSLLFRTTNSGYNWSQIMNNNGFNDMVFVDTLTGYKTYDSTRKTTDGGLTWKAQKRPILNSWNSFYKFSLINKDTIWGVGGAITTPNGDRGIVYKTTNGGLNWGYQIPDTAINIWFYDKINFYKIKNGWAYAYNKGIHTISGGNDTTFFTNIKEQITNNATNFVLFQNYPNPFNAISKIKYKISKTEFRSQNSEVRIIVYNITGKEIGTLVNKKQSSGEYEVKFDGSNLGSGIYFYTLFVDEIRVDTKKAVLIK